MTRQLAIAGTLLLLLGRTIAEARTGSATLPRTSQKRPKPHEGETRQLVCRGISAVQLTGPRRTRVATIPTTRARAAVPPR